MRRWLCRYKSSALFAMICGALTMLLGIVSMIFRREAVSYGAVTAVMIINTALHYESFFSALRREKKRQSNVLSMAIAETVLLLFLAVTLRAMGWREFVILISVYLVFNGTSLMGIPSAFSQGCGMLASVLGAALFLLGRQYNSAASFLAGINLIVNGAERIGMSILGGKKQNPPDIGMTILEKGELTQFPRGKAFVENMIAARKSHSEEVTKDNEKNMGEGSDKIVKSMMTKMPLGSLVTYGVMTFQQLDGLIASLNQ